MSWTPSMQSFMLLPLDLQFFHLFTGLNEVKQQQPASRKLPRGCLKSTVKVLAKCFLETFQ